MQVQQSMASGNRAAAWKYCLQMLPLVPWFARYPILGIAMAMLGLPAYRALARLKDGVVDPPRRHEGR